MRAATLNAPEDLRLVEKDKPTPGKNEVLLKIEANTMCGTDYRLYTGAKTSGIAYDTVPGHEIAGRIVEIGEGVEQIQPDLRTGQQATVSIVVSCGHCSNCLQDREHLCSNLELFGYAIDGGLQEYMLVPERALRRGNLITTSQELTPQSSLSSRAYLLLLKRPRSIQSEPGRGSGCSRSRPNRTNPRTAGTGQWG